MNFLKSVLFLSLGVALLAATGCSKKDFVAERNTIVFADTAPAVTLSEESAAKPAMGYPAVDSNNVGKSKMVYTEKGKYKKTTNFFGLPQVDKVNQIGSYENALPNSQFDFERSQGKDIGLYKVKKGDSLKSIAKELYGDENSWKELFYFNKTALMKAKKLKVGMTLKFERDSYVVVTPNQIQKVATYKAGAAYKRQPASFKKAHKAKKAHHVSHE